MKPKTIFFILFFTFALFLITSCDTTNLPNSTLTLKLKEIASTEIWLTLKSEIKPLPLNIKITNNNKVFKKVILTTNDTILFFENLKPLNNYSFSVEVVGEELRLKSDIINCTTLDTTTHNYTWETFYFGNGGATSVLEDIEIIDENNIWVVGDIQDAGYDKDSVWHDSHNVVKWDGTNWNLERILGYGFCNPNNKYGLSLQSMWLDKMDNIWVSGGSHLVNVTQEKVYCNSHITRLNKLEGFNDGGTIIVNHTNKKSMLNYFKEGGFGKIELDDDGYIMDLLPLNKDNGERIILFPQSNYRTKKYQLLSINSKREISLYSTLPNYTSSAWTKKGFPLFICGGSSVYDNRTGKWKEVNSNSTYSVSRISGSNLNNIFAIGWGNVVHYNGSTWKKFDELTGYYYTIAVKDNIVVIAGMENNKAVVVIGRKN